MNCPKNVGICRLDQRFATETCIIVETVLQIQICVRKAPFIWPKVYFFITIFCYLLEGTRKSRGDANLAWISNTTQLFRISS